MGGSAGTISLPSYLAIQHTWTMDANRAEDNSPTGHNHSGINQMNVYDDMWAARNGPYQGHDAYDPDEALEDMLAEVVEFETAIGTLDPETDYAGFVDRVAADINLIVQEEEITGMSLDTIEVAAPGTVATITVDRISLPIIAVGELVSAFENRQSSTHGRSVGRFAAGMSDINAVMASSFVIGMGSLESEKQYQIEEFDAKASISAAEKEFDGELQGELAFQRANLEKDMQDRTVQAAYDTQDQQLEYDADKVELMTTAELKKELPRLRVQSYLQGVNQMAAMLAQKMSLQGQETGQQLQYGQMKIVSETDETNRNLEIDHLDFTWDLSLYEYMERWMAAPTGAVVSSAGKASKASSGLAGAMAGAQAGAAVGGPIGAGIGGVLGGIGGLL